MIDTRDLYDELQDLRTCASDYLESPEECVPLTDDERERLDALESLAQDIGEDTMRDGDAGPMIPVADFPDYARDLATDISPLASSTLADQWPFTCIDWDYAAHELSHDYTLVTFNGTDYYVRSN